MERELHNRVKGIVGMLPVPIVDDDMVNGEVIDTIGFESLEYFISFSQILSGFYDFILEEDDDIGFGSPRTLGSDEILGSTGSFTMDDQFSVRQVGSLAKKRFQRLSIQSNSVEEGVLPSLITVIAVLGNSRVNPVPDVIEFLP